MTVHWTKNAVEQLLLIYEYLSQPSALYAQRIIDRLTKRSEQIAIFPRSGRVVPEYDRQDIREVIEKPYRIIYRITEHQIDVLAVVHSSRLLPPEL